MYTSVLGPHCCHCAAAPCHCATVPQVIPELTGTRKLKLQFRPVDTRRPSGSGRR